MEKRKILNTAETAAVMVYLILLCAVLALTQADTGSLDMYLIFNDYRGDDRAYIW